MKLERREGEAKDQLRLALTASGAEIETLLRDSLASGGKIKGLKIKGF